MANETYHCPVCLKATHHAGLAVLYEVKTEEIKETLMVGHSSQPHFQEEFLERVDAVLAQFNRPNPDRAMVAALVARIEVALRAVRWSDEDMAALRALIDACG